MERERRFGNRFGNRGHSGNNGQKRFNNRNSFQPVKEGEELNVVIEAVAEKGDGVAKKSGFVIFVPGTKTGDKVKIRVKKVAKKVAFAEVIGSYESNEIKEETSNSAETEQSEYEGDQSQEESYDESQDSEEF